MSNAVKLDIYLNFPGTCEEAFTFYETHLGGTIHMKMPHQEIPPHFPAAWENPMLHAVMEIGGMRVRGADIPGAQPMRSAYLTLNLATVEEAGRVYEILSEEGEIFMEMAETGFAKRFAMLRDKFGIAWMLLHQV